MDKPRTTPKDFFLWAGAMVALYAGVVSFITLLFEYLNYTFPDTALQGFYDPYSSGISYEMASLIVLAPLFLILMRLIRREIAADASRAEIWVRRWALFLTLFIAGATVAIDLIVLINTFLSGGEITVRFLLKVAVVLLVASAIFMHFIADLWGYWAQYPERARRVNYGVGVLVVFAIVGGFFIVGTPMHARDIRIDDERVSNLQTIQSQVVYYFEQKQALPQNLNQLNDAISGFSVPTDPVTEQQYGYSIISDHGFQLCATFAADSNGQNIYGPTAPVPYGGASGMNGTNDNWAHGSGQSCFVRYIDPDLYPPAGKIAPTN